MHSNILAIKIRNIIKTANKNIGYIRIPGHCEIDKNEKSDKKASETVNKPMTEIGTYSYLVIDIHKDVSNYIVPIYGTLSGGVQQKPNSAKLKILPHIGPNSIYSIAMIN